MSRNSTPRHIIERRIEAAPAPRSAAFRDAFRDAAHWVYWKPDLVPRSTRVFDDSGSSTGTCSQAGNRTPQLLG